MATHGTAAACARRATPATVFPKADCRSSEPSPVSARSAVDNRSSRRTARAGCAAARDRQDRDTDVSLHDVRVVRQRPIKLGDGDRIGPLLGPVDGARPARARQRIRHIREHTHLDRREATIESRGVDARQPRQRRPTGRKQTTVVVQQAGAQRDRGAGAPVIRGAATDADQDSFDARIERRPNQLSGAG